MLNVVYPAAESVDDRRFDDLVAILEAVLTATEPDFGPFRMRPSTQVMTSRRYVHELMAGRTPNLIWTSTSKEREQKVRPIRIPLRRGLLSFRISLIHKGDQSTVDRIQSPDDLKGVRIVQGTGWGDIEIFNAYGAEVITSPYESLFRMIEADRALLFPRGVNEVFDEFEARRNDLPDLAVEQNLLIYYPWPYYFFVAKDNEALATRLEVGLDRIIESGELETIFQKYHGKVLERARLEERRLIRLENPLLPAETPLDDERLWLRPASLFDGAGAKPR
ncbi:hypothetical protein D777_02598 [Marinobacter nitratireducens]|uniref:Uncharacterized protein n=1 Tax=Marinobacter nitratireducens TaxID=1137280 RepID=A0A072MZK4_9GAMM|nr:transporter substrate-binding domain-containing protein [Marinobacter nitratireducens]KEF30656.1 hypothetical protein D777_02598 [Marinobacter nitratireducens]